MAKEIPAHLYVGALILLIGAGLVGGEYYLVRWLPGHRQRVRDEILSLVSYRNDGLGIDMQIASGLYGTVESFPGGVRITKSKFWSIGPSLTITSQSNPDQSGEFSQNVVSKWLTDGVTQELPRYHCEHTKIKNRDAVIIRQFKDRAMLLTARIISPDRIIEANCTPGQADEDLYMEACDETVRSIHVAGPEPPPPAPPGGEVLELHTPFPKAKTASPSKKHK